MAWQVRPPTVEERATLDRLVRAQTAPVRLARRARIIQLAAGGARIAGIARRLGVTPTAV